MKLMEKIIRKRNPVFRFDSEVHPALLLRVGWQFGWSQLRAMRLLIYRHGFVRRFLGRNVSIVNGRKLRLGQWVRIGDNCTLSAFGKGELSIGDGSGIGSFSKLVVSANLADAGAGIKLGRNVGMGEFAYLGGAGGLEIGDDCIIGQYFSCHPENHHFADISTPIRLQGVERKGIRIGRNCWIGAKVTVLDGVEIGDDCVIAAGAVVTKSMPAGSVIGGVPARIIRSRFSVLSDQEVAV